MAHHVDDHHHRNLLIILAREPALGLVKTRLAATIGPERARALYAAFLTDLAVRFSPAGLREDFAVAWAMTPESRGFPAKLRELAGDGLTDGVTYIRQDGHDLGVRQVNLLHWGAQHGYDRTVLMASDSPQVTTHAVAGAFAALDGADVALGRVHDGGYYLIGARGFHDPISGVPMGTRAVADGIRERAHSLGLSVAEIAPTFDVDVEADLALLVEAIRPAGAPAPATWAALQRLGLMQLSDGPYSQPPPVGSVSR